MQHVACENTAAVVINLIDLHTVDGSPQVMVQHARVVVGAISNYHSTIHQLLYGCFCPACRVVWSVIEWCTISCGRMAIINFSECMSYIFFALLFYL